MKAKEDATKSGKTCAKVRVETTKKFGDKTYSTRFDVVVYAGLKPVLIKLSELEGYQKK